MNTYGVLSRFFPFDSIIYDTHEEVKSWKRWTFFDGLLQFHYLFMFDYGFFCNESGMLTKVWMHTQNPLNCTAKIPLDNTIN